MDMLTTDISSLGYKAVKEKVPYVSAGGNVRLRRGKRRK